MPEDLSFEDLFIASEEKNTAYLYQVADESERIIQEGEEEIRQIELRIQAAKRRQKKALELRDALKGES